ncbi:MAG: sialate O-acetylesterase [Planctomycetota bacterium]
MNIETGLFDHGVLQRGAGNVSHARVTGTCGDRGPVTLTVLRKGAPLRGFSKVRAGTAGGGRFRAVLAGIPAGGPYTVTLAVGDRSVMARDVLVGDVWLLGGQSNMQGVGLLKDAPRPHPLVRAFYMYDAWGVAKEPLHELHDAIDPVHAMIHGGRPARNTVAGVGPGMAFALEMRRLTGVPQGVVACAHGGTGMNQWDPRLKKLKGRSLYGAMLRRFLKNGGRAAGLVWYQGESEAGADAAPLYTRRMRKFVAALRRDTGGRRFPVALVQIGRVASRNPEGAPFWDSVREQQRLLPRRIPLLTTVPAIDLALDDTIHISGKDQSRLGTRLARAMRVIREGRTAGRPPIELRKFHARPGRDGRMDIFVEFSNVAGRLEAGSRPEGFSIGSPGSRDVICDTQLAGRRVILRTALGTDEIGPLGYGIGTNPYGNIRDGEDRSLPAFGPLPLGTPRALTPFVTRLQVSRFLPPAGNLGRLACPKNLRALGLVTRAFIGDFCDLHTEIGPRAPADNLVFFAFRFRCPEPMPLRALIGYDGPVVAWVNGRRIFHDPKGTNPALPTDKGRAPFRAAKGEHEIIVALGTNRGAAWGVFLRLERMDVPRRLLREGPGGYRMPVILG